MAQLVAIGYRRR